VIRTKGRRRFTYNGRRFVWYIARDIKLRIASNDKQFAVMYELIGNSPLFAVSGPEFLGVPATIKRPVWLVPPRFTRPLGSALVREVLEWCIDASHEIVRYEGLSQTTIQRAWDSL
jgi:hypothetical protein